MQIITNRFSPGHPRYNTPGDLDKLITHAAPENEFLFWSQDELDFFNAYCLMHSKHFTSAKLWGDRFDRTSKSHWGRLFIRIPSAAPKPRLP